MEYHDIALVQLHAAIDLYFQENYIPAITLAGAAEELLGKILEYSKGGKSFVNDLYENNVDVIPVANKNEMVKHLNNTRDLLKHFNPSRPIHEFKPVDDAAFMIMRAISNYVHLVGTKTDRIERFVNDKVVLQIIQNYQ